MCAVILGIETSCDETAVALVENGRRVLSNAVYSQIELHQRYGGVVPEVASRNHVAKLPYLTDIALKDAGMAMADVDAVAVTYAPGLIGALITGVSYAKALSYASGKPLYAVNHIDGHICANYITHSELVPPFLCLVVSGGHTNIVMVTDFGKYQLLGSTRDDACGEALDKIARILGLPYPGGPHLEKLAAKGDPHRYSYPKGFKGETHLDFTFSGLKTAVINHKHTMDQTGEQYETADIAASFQQCVVDVLVHNTFEAACRTRAQKIALAGGVSANGLLRGTFASECQKRGLQLFFPDLAFTGDNAAMIASAGYFDSLSEPPASLDLNARPHDLLFG